MKAVYCVMPWIHVHTRPNGDASPCCVYNMSQPLGNTNTSSIEDIAHSPKFNNLRRAMINHKPPRACSDCVSKQHSNIEHMSYRHWQNEGFKNIIPELLENTNTDGSLKEVFKMRFMNIRYSNLCNMACRTCGSFSSSLWAQELKHDKHVINITDTQPNYIEDIYKRLPYVDHINFAGGESLLIHEHWQILDKLIELGKYDVKILYVTNLSKLSYQNKNILDYAVKFPNMVIMGSVDASHQRAELYRHGTHWPTIEKNLKTIYNSNVKFRINCTIGAMNIWHAPDLQKYLLDNNLIKDTQFFINILTEGQLLSSKVLPTEFKHEVAEKIRLHQEWLDLKGINSTQWSNVIEFTLKEDHSYLLKDFIEYNLKLDTTRKQNTIEVFPELEKIFGAPERTRTSNI